jgi:hypothetical protein
MQTITVIPRIEKDGTPILFLPDDEANPGRIACYVRVGQHSEADLGYYRTTKPDKTGACADLIKEYENLGPDKCTVKIRKRRA